MRFSSTLLIASIATIAPATSLSSGQIRSINALNKIMGRQTRLCKLVTVKSCALSCGDGYVTCVAWPTCYNPGAGDTCCSDGQYCEKGTYCTDGGCCPDGSSLDECGATVSLSIILPVTEPATTSTTTTSSTGVTTTTKSSTVVTTTLSSSSAVVSSTSSSVSKSSTTTSASSSSVSSSSSSLPTTTTRPTTTRAPSSGSSTSSNLPQFTGAAQSVGVGAAQVAIGGLAMFMML